MWTEVERRVEAKIEEYATHQHFKHLEHNYWDDVMHITKKCPEQLEKSDLKYILSRKKDMFPQNNIEVSFTPHWAQVLNAFLMYAVSVYLELIKSGKVPACGLHQELKAMRPEVIVAVKSLFSKRWRSIRGHDYYAGDVGGGDYASLQFMDETNGQLWPPTFTTRDQKDNQIGSVKTVLFKVRSRISYISPSII